jgi:GT2 family glycosyltransferase
MGDRPLVSVVTGTYNRPDLLLKAVHNVRQQTYRPLEHVIVHDGPMPDEVANALDSAIEAPSEDVDINVVELGFQTSQFLAYSVAAAPFMVAQLLARGPLQLWMSDDEEMDPEHIESLFDLLESGNHDFVYSKCRMYRASDPSRWWIAGMYPQDGSNCTGVLYRRELLDYKCFVPHIGDGTDLTQVTEWIQAGASYAMLDRVGFTHRVDKDGDTGPGSRLYRQPLRGTGRPVYIGPRWNGFEMDHYGRIIKPQPGTE